MLIPATEPGTQLVPSHTNACPIVGMAVAVSTSASALTLDVVYTPLVTVPALPVILPLIVLLNVLVPPIV